MARIPYVDPESAPPKVREALDALPQLNVFRLVANAETAFRPWLRYGAAILGEGELDAKLRELAILRVAALTGARYEWVQHADIAVAVGATREQVETLERGEIDAACFDAAEQLVLRATTELVSDFGTSEATMAELAERFSPREIVELVLSAGHYLALAVLMNSAAIDLDAALGEDVLKGVVSRGREA
jgi:AhpD family alkylhydroperoxidase